MSKKAKSKAKAKLPPLAYPKRRFGKDELRDDLRVWLLDWFKTHEIDDAGVFWQRRKDRNISMCDITLDALAPFMTELLVDRAGGIVAAEKVLAMRFMESDGGAGSDWLNGFDVNLHNDKAMVVGNIPWSREKWKRSLADYLSHVLRDGDIAEAA